MMSSNKILGFVSILSLLILSLGFASALTISAPSRDLSITNTDSVLTLTNNGAAAENVTLTIANIVSGSNQVLLSISPTSIANLAPSATQALTASISNMIGKLPFGTYSAAVTAAGTSSNATGTVNFVSSFCKSGDVGGNLTIDRVDISNTGVGKDDEWNYLDTVEVEVKVENIGTSTVRGVTIEIGLYDSTGRNRVSDLDFQSSDEESIDIGSLADGDKDTETFTFRVPADMDDGTYKLVVKAFSDDLGENRECTDTSSDFSSNKYFTNVDVKRETDKGKLIAIDNIDVKPQQATCGDTVLLAADVFNVGNKDQDQVKINIANSDLKLSQDYEIKNNLDIGDKQRVSFSFVLPQGLQNKAYVLALSSQYDYRNGEYRESSDESTQVPLTVIGCTSAAPAIGTTSKIASISASLASSAKAGQDIVIESTITNTGSTGMDYVVNPTGFESWASLKSVSDKLISLASGQSKDVTLTFTANKDASGENDFTLEVRSGSNLETKRIAVNVEPTSTGFSGFNLGDNALIWVIGIINVILIILIIVVAVKVSRR